MYNQNFKYPFITSLAQEFGKPVVIIDTETTGFPNHPKTRLVEFAYLSVLPTGEIRSGEKLINPRVKIPHNVSEIHGIYDQHVQNAPEFPSIASLVEKICTQAVFCGYNSESFDYPMIQKSFGHYGLKAPIVQIHLDVRKVWTGKMKTQKGKLVEVAKYFGVEIGEEHRAGGDVLTTANILNEMINKWGMNFVKQIMKIGQLTKALAPNESLKNKNEFVPSVKKKGNNFIAPSAKGFYKNRNEYVGNEILSFIETEKVFSPNDFSVIEKKLKVNKAAVSFALKDLLDNGLVEIADVIHYESQEALDRHLKEAIEVCGGKRLKPLKEYLDKKCGFDIEYNQLRIGIDELFAKESVDVEVNM